MPTNTPIIGRFAPSPSGRMHLGNVLCALLSWLSVRAQGGQFILRMEDLDTARCPRHHADQLLDDLRWLGLDWDIGPDLGEPDALHYQSLRAATYQHYYNQLQQAGRLYPCYCTRAALHAASAPHASDGQPIYAGTCYTLTTAQRAAMTRAPATRVHVPSRTLTVHDHLQGDYTVNLAHDCGDYIVRRSDGMFGYQLAVVVDDALQGVTEVVRGKDLLSSTPWQMELLESLGFPVPQYYHIPLLVDHNGRRLAKRDADLDLSVLRQKYTPEQVIGALACAANLQSHCTPLRAKDLIPHFSWHDLSCDFLSLPVHFC